MKYQMPLLIVVVAITLIYAYSKKIRITKKACVQAVTVVLTLFSGLRSWWMGDLIKYYTLYRSCNGENWLEAVFGNTENVGIRLFFKVAGTLHISYDICLFLIAALVAISLGVLVFQYSPSPYWSYLMYIGMGFYLFTYSGLKQSIAMSLIIFAACGYFEQKPLKIILWTVAAAMFHAPAMIFLLVFLLPKKKLGAKYLVVVAMLFAASFLLKGQLVELLSQAYYDDLSTYENINEVGGRFIMMLVIMAAALVLRPLRIWDQLYVRVFNLMVLAAICQIFSVYSNNFSRLADYFYQFVALFIPMMLENGYQQAARQPDRAREIRHWSPQIYAIAAIGITVFSFWYYNSYIGNLNNFQFFWQIDPYALYGA